MKKITTLLALAFTLCASAQTDVTYKIQNPSFENNGAEGWTNTNLVPQTNTSFKEKQGNVYMEKWTSAGNSAAPANIKQTVKNLVKGKYKLTVAAQNIQQNNSAEQTGAYIYAKNILTKQVVTVAADYSVEFDLATTSTPIGFAADNATGNWIACDNFRLTFLSTTPDIVTALIETAKEQFNKKLNDAAINALNKAIKDAEDAIAGNVEDLTGVANALQDTYTDAQTITKAYTNLRNIIVKANLLVGKKMNAATETALNNALAAANNALETTDNDPIALGEALQKAYDEANASIAAYEKFIKVIEKAESYYDASKKGAAEYAATVAIARDMYDNGTATNEDITEQTKTLERAQLEFNLANVTGNAADAPEVTETNHYVVTGATEAMVRATFKGDNIIEKGVCWSTSHNPTVLDDRTTKNLSLNGTIIHVKGLNYSTEYYVRPYAINANYQVGYGDEVKIVTHPMGTCSWSWDEGAPDDAANTRCRNAMKETIDYFNEWTGIKGFFLSGHYGAGTPTADCSYGGWMRIGPKASYQAIGTVIHETGHGVGVGTSDRWWDSNVHDWKWFGREANQIYSFLENKEADPYHSDFCMVGDGTHGWGSSASYDWFVNGADKDKHQELQYIGGCALLYGLFIDGLCPTNGYKNGLSGYTYNFEEGKKYYLMNKDAECGLGEGLLTLLSDDEICWRPVLLENEIPESAAWYFEYDAKAGYYSIRNASNGKYLYHTNGSSYLKFKDVADKSKLSSAEQFQFMPDRKDVTIGKGDAAITTHGYWITWNGGNNVALKATAISGTKDYGTTVAGSFDYSDKATKQQWIIISEDEIKDYHFIANPTGIKTPSVTNGEKVISDIYSADGRKNQSFTKGVNIIRYSDGTVKKVIK